MALPVLPNPSNFLGVALVINRSKGDGPKFVFHYPQHIHASQPRSAREVPEEDFDDNFFLERASQSTTLEAGGFSSANPANFPDWDQDEHLTTDSGTQIVPWEHVAGFPTRDLESILTPARSYHKKLFQLSLDPLYCVSYPIYAPESGSWKKKKKPPKVHKSSGSKPGDESEATDGNLAKSKEWEHIPSEAEYIQIKDMAMEMPKTSKDEPMEDKRSSMTMFNLVFFLNPSKHESKELIDSMYTHIIKKANKLYKYSQQRSDFVWKESKRILALKDKGREDKRRMGSLWSEILATSSLAASMLDIYNAISQNKIAALQLDTVEGMVTHWVQIPVPFHISDLPPDREAEPRGLWMTTANHFISEDFLEEPDFLAKNFGLLLMEDEKKIIAELQADPDESTVPMIEFVRHSKPTLSFYQVGQASNNILTPGQVRKFAQHFIYWRRAMAIPPLHARDMYVVSPNANMDLLPRASTEWRRLFPLAPPLPDFLADLSVAPRPYKTHCPPGKAHRALYMAMLAWLVRGGWVTQLCTFAYVVVWPEIIYEVEYALEAEEIKRAQELRRRDSATTNSSSTAASSSGGDGSASRSASDASLPGDDEDMNSSAATLRDLAKAPPSRIPEEAAGDSSGSEPSSSTSSLKDDALSSPPPPAGHHHQHHQSPTGRSGGGATVSFAPSLLPTSLSSSSLHAAALSARPHHHQPSLAEQVAEKARLDRLADRAARELAERATAHGRRLPPAATRHPSTNDAPHLAAIVPHVILDAGKATGKESLFLSAIERRLRDAGGSGGAGVLSPGGAGPGGGAGTSGGGGGGSTTAAGGLRPGVTPSTTKTVAGFRLGSLTLNLGGNSRDGAKKDTAAAASKGSGGSNGGGGAKGVASVGPADDGWDERVADAWPRLWKYFNGRSALERIALHEDMKRKEVWNLLTAMSEYLLCVRHW